MERSLQRNAAVRTISNRAALVPLASLLLVAAPAGALSEFGIEGMHVVSTPASEVRASVSADGRRIIWGSSDRSGGPGGWDLWRSVAIADQQRRQRFRSDVQRGRTLAVFFLQPRGRLRR
jgi:hypothetical protein